MPTILCCGGGTMGPVTPLIAVLRAMSRRRPDIRFIWAGTPDGPERTVIEAEGIPFYPIPVAKLPRYPSRAWIEWPFRYVAAVSAASRIIREFRPDIVIGAGGFTQVPMMRSASRKGISCAIHQLDALPGLANRSVARHCRLVTTSFQYDASPFAHVASQYVPTPCRFARKPFPSRADAARSFSLDPDRPIVAFLGGGTGARALNDAVWRIREALLTKMQVIHQTGFGKRDAHVSGRGYRLHEFLDEDQMSRMYGCADVVVARAGLGTLSELACFSKPTILIPIPDSHQEENARRVPVSVVSQVHDFPSTLMNEIQSLLSDGERAAHMGRALHEALPTDDGSALAELWLELLA